jgi:predicted permease
MNRILPEIRYALRQLRSSPGFALTAIFTLALGIGANTAIFTLFRGILLQTLPVANPGQLYRIGDTDTCCVNGGFMNDTGDFDLFSYDLFLHLRNSAPEFEKLAAMQSGGWKWTVRRGNGEPKPLAAEFVTGNYFDMFGIGAYSGRVFNDQDDTPASDPSVVLSYQAWQSEFAADPTIIGSTIYVQTKPFTVIGIAPAGFFGDRVSDRPPALWMPVQMEPYVREDSTILHHSDSNWLYAIGRVRKGTQIGELQAKLSVALRQWLTTRPMYTANGGINEISKQHVVIAPGGGGIQILQIQKGAGLRLLMILSSVVLLIACANIANLLLARATSRRSDVALRMAVGAGRTSIIRQIFIESVVLSCIGGLAGLVVAYAGSRTILALAFPDARNLPISPSPNLLVLGFAFLVSLLTGVVFATAPAWLSLHAQPAEALRGVNRTTRDRASFPQKTLVIFQVALSVVLITSAVLLARSLANLENQNFGVATTHRYVAHFDSAGAGYKGERLTVLNREIEQRFSSLPGIENVGLAMYSPLEGDNWGECVIQQGHPAPRPEDKCGATWDRVSTHFLDAVGVPIIEGRNFTTQDTSSSPFVALVNEAFVKRFYPNQDPIGQHFGIDLTKYSGQFEIVGVFRDFKMNRPKEEVKPVFLRHMPQRFNDFSEDILLAMETQSMYMNAIVIDFRIPPNNVDSLVRQTMYGIDPNLPIRDIRSMDEQVARNFQSERLVARLTMLFGLLALVLAAGRDRAGDWYSRSAARWPFDVEPAIQRPWLRFHRTHWCDLNSCSLCRRGLCDSCTSCGLN